MSANVQHLVSWGTAENGEKLSLEKQNILQKVIDSIYHKGKYQKNRQTT